MNDYKIDVKHTIFFLWFVYWSSGVTGNFFSGGVQQIQLRTEDRENWDLGAVAP